MSNRTQMPVAPLFRFNQNYFVKKSSGLRVINRNRQPGNSIRGLELHARHETSSLRQLYVVVMNEGIGQPYLFEQADPRQKHRLRNDQRARHHLTQISATA